MMGKLLWTTIFLYLFVLHALLAALLTNPELLTTLPQRRGKPPHPERFVSDMLAYHARMDVTVPAGTHLFFGDSNTQSLATAAVSDRSANFGIGMLDSVQLLAALPTYGSMRRAGSIYITIGTNDFLAGRQAGLEARLRDIDARLPAGIPVVWSGILPLAGQATTRAPNAEIAEVNRNIREICGRRPACTYVDTWALLASPDGRGQAGYFLPDGVHLSPAGYNAWIRGLREAAYKSNAAVGVRTDLTGVEVLPKDANEFHQPNR